MNVKRYEMKTTYRGHESWDSLEEDEEGSYVDYEDYVALEKKLTDLAVQLANAESKCRELAAENAEMRSSIDATIGWQESTDPENGESVRMLVDIKTPATDAFLAEVLAQGVEELASMAGNECKRYKSVNDRAGVRKWKSIVILCSDFATQLRKGAAL